jgi:hypothetical protein
MNSHGMHTGGDLAVADTTYERSDVRMRAIVNHGISMQETSTTISALEYLKSHEIAPDVIARVLHDPAQRKAFPHH